jgi:hypothetical protein
MQEARARKRAQPARGADAAARIKPTIGVVDEVK